MKVFGMLGLVTYRPAAAILAGLLGGIAFLAVVYAGFGMGTTRMDFLRILGSMMAPKGTRASTYGIGFVIHMMLSAAFGLAHAGILTGIGISSVGSAAALDALIGAAHGVGVLIVLPVMLAMAHPLVRSGDIDPPRTLLTGFGPMTPIGSLAAHVVFGAVNGWIYAVVAL